MNPELDALLSLLADETPSVRDAVRRRFLAHGSGAVPALRVAGESPDPAVRIFARRLIAEILRGDADRRMLEFLAEEDPDLELGAYHIERIWNPDLDDAACREALDDLAGDARPILARAGSPRARIESFARYMTQDQGFRGNTERFYHTHNSFISRILKRRVGIPISLSVVYLLVARRLDLPLRGVGMPYHFLVRYEEDPFRIYVDPFSSGRLMTADDCAQFLRKCQLDLLPRHLAPVTNRDMLRRMICNLLRICTSSGRRTEAQRLTRYVEALNTRRGGAAGAATA